MFTMLGFCIVAVGLYLALTPILGSTAAAVLLLVVGALILWGKIGPQGLKYLMVTALGTALFLAAFRAPTVTVIILDILYWGFVLSTLALLCRNKTRPERIKIISLGLLSAVIVAALLIKLGIFLMLLTMITAALMAAGKLPNGQIRTKKRAPRPA